LPTTRCYITSIYRIDISWANRRSDHGIVIRHLGRTRTLRQQTEFATRKSV
jgi:hypothetical protein